MASTAKLAMVRAPQIDPTLKAFIDECVVPLMVRKFMSQVAADKPLAPIAAPEVDSNATAPASASEGER
jgi:hypothetical protein